VQCFWLCARESSCVATSIRALRPTGIRPVNRIAFEDNFFPCVQSTRGADCVVQRVQAGYKTKQEQVKPLHITTNGDTFLLVPVDKISPLAKAQVAWKAKKKQRPEVSQKETKLTSITFRSALQATRKKEIFQTRPENVKQKYQNGARRLPNLSHDCKFCKMFEGISEDSMIQCTSCKKWCYESCARRTKEAFLWFNCKWIGYVVMSFSASSK